jgi:Arc/MetJ-type ribon-helix-helix transcriptional regulator
MSQGLSPQNEQFISDAIASGQFATREAVLDQALDNLRRQRQAQEKLNRELQKGVDELDAGLGVEMTENDFDRLADEAIAEATREVKS